MEEREWRKVLWRFEVGSKIADGVSLALAVAFLGHFFYAVEHEGLLHWAWWLAIEAALLIPAAVAAWWCYPRAFQWDWDRTRMEDWEEREEYRAAKVARDKHEETLWKTQVDILKAQEQARSELEELEDRVGRRMREIEKR